MADIGWTALGVALFVIGLAAFTGYVIFGIWMLGEFTNWIVGLVP